MAFEELRALSRLLAGLPAPWFVCGGWAIDLFAGRVTRPHSDLEVGVYRRDQGLVRSYMAGWRLHKAVQGPEGGQWVPWDEGEWLELPVHQIRACEGGEPPRFEFFLNEAADGRWRWRRNPALSRHLEEVILIGELGIPMVAPEIQLLYKAKGHRPKDDQDFATALPLLDAGRRAWLKAALQTHHPGDPWIGQLS